jgi:hypothetical protein
MLRAGQKVARGPACCGLAQLRRPTSTRHWRGTRRALPRHGHRGIDTDGGVSTFSVGGPRELGAPAGHGGHDDSALK